MDYESTSEDFFLISLLFDHPLIAIPALIIGIVFAVKACNFEEDCSHKTCNTGHAMVVKGECLCVEKAK